MVTKLDHIAIATDNLRKTLNFYKKTLGFKLKKIKIFQQENIKVAILRNKNLDLEIIEPATSGDTSHIKKFIKEKGPGIHHISFKVENLESAIKKCKSAGYKIAGNVRKGIKGKNIVFIHPKSTFGVLIELVE